MNNLPKFTLEEFGQINAKKYPNWDKFIVFENIYYFYKIYIGIIINA